MKVKHMKDRKLLWGVFSNDIDFLDKIRDKAPVKPEGAPRLRFNSGS